MKDLMVDLETWGTSTNAVIVQIGAVYFNRYTGETGDEFTVNVDPQSGINAGFQVDGDTILWWMNQSRLARLSIIDADRHDIGVAMEWFNNFWSRAKYVWSHATFDFTILMNHLNRLGIKSKTHYRAARDIRTLTHLAQPLIRKPDMIFPERPKDNVAHNALSDCHYQVEYCVNCFNAIMR